MGQLQRPHSNRAGAAGRGGRPHRQGRCTPAPPLPRARCYPPPLAHPPCAPHRCSTWQDGDTALDNARARNHSAVVALLEAAQQGGGVGRAAAGGGAAAAGAAAAAAARHASWKRARTASDLDKQFFFAVKRSKMDEATRLLAAGADPNGHTSYVRACARAASLPAAPAPFPRPSRAPPRPCQLRGTHHSQLAATAHRSLTSPPSFRQALPGTRRL
jgi:hypothetical protein